MGAVIVGLGIGLSIAVSLGLGWLGAGWLVGQLLPEALFAGVMWGITAVILTLLCVVGWAIYRDKLWHGLMHPIPFMGSMVLLLLALLSLPSLWGQLRLLAEGITAVATIESLTTGIDYDPESNITNTIYYLTYRFMADDGESYRERIEVSQSMYQSSSEGDEISITYLPNRPGYSLPETAVQPERRARRIFMYLLAVAVVLVETAVLQFFWSRGLESFLDRWD